MYCKEYTVEIPNHEWRYQLSKKAMPKYYKSSELDKLPKKYLNVRGEDVKGYLADTEGNRFVKNSKSVGEPRYWTVNGQGLYSGTLHHSLRSKITDHYHKYIKEYIKDSGITEIDGSYISIQCEIYEARRSKMPDASNLWIWIKWFEDALQELNMLKGDDNKVVQDTGRIIYREVDSEDDNCLVFTIKAYDMENIGAVTIKQFETILKLLEVVDEDTFIPIISYNIKECRKNILIAKAMYIEMMNKKYGTEMDITADFPLTAKWDDISYGEKLYTIENELERLKRGLEGEALQTLKAVSRDDYSMMRSKIKEAYILLKLEQKEYDGQKDLQGN